MPLSHASKPAAKSPQHAARAREPLALRREDAAAAIGVSDETFDKHVRPTLPVVRLGSVRVYPVDALRDWLCEHADSPIDELERHR
jgi:hypothetical protein